MSIRALTIIPAAALVAALVVVLVSNGDVLAISAAQEGANAARGNDTPGTLFGDAGIISTITNYMLFFAGALTVIMVIIGGLRYTLSGGNASNVTAAKNTILYAIVGLIVAFLAFAAVNYIVGFLAPGGAINASDI